jgi:hypothetical protein
MEFFEYLPENRPTQPDIPEGAARRRRRLYGQDGRSDGRGRLPLPHVLDH